MSEIMPKSEHSLQIIAQIHNDFPEKFGVPHQSGWLKKQKAQIFLSRNTGGRKPSAELRSMIISG